MAHLLFPTHQQSQSRPCPLNTSRPTQAPLSSPPSLKSPHSPQGIPSHTPSPPSQTPMAIALPSPSTWVKRPRSLAMHRVCLLSNRRRGGSTGKATRSWQHWLMTTLILSRIGLRLLRSLLRRSR
ncbi:hypothetical protein FGO68_gene10821 [Halteria grandinella]|uniref:Uncharacterized protein n=1 Tax=Halteria grandinella TaxID=5974 RepID=A0A8J8P3P1_HALGN|nr:hypothetical protein FGO68_gene10821 [Halteria grandinella]